MKPERTEEQNWLNTACLLILATVAGAAALIYTRGVLVPFVLAIFIATMVAPVIDVLLTRLKFPRPLAVVTAMLVVLAGMSLLLVIMIIAVQAVGEFSFEYVDRFKELAQRGLDQVNEMITRFNPKASTIQIEDLELQANRLAGEMARQGVGIAPTIISHTTLTLIFVAFILAGRNPHVIRKGIYAEIDSKVRQYIVTKVLLSSATGILVFIVLRIMGLPMAGTFGLLTFLLNFIPSIGSVIATLLPLPIAVAHYNDNFLMVALVLLLPGTIQGIIGNAIEPKVMGEGLELHPVTVLLALAFWGLAWGVVGMVLAVPMTATIRIVLMRFATTRPVGQLLAGQLPEDTSAA